MFTCEWAWPVRSPICTIWGLMGEQSSQKCEIPCLGRRWTADQNMTPLALSLKFVTVQTHTYKKTVNDISALCLSVCVKKGLHFTKPQGSGVTLFRCDGQIHKTCVKFLQHSAYQEILLKSVHFWLSYSKRGLALLIIIIIIYTFV